MKDTEPQLKKLAQPISENLCQTHREIEQCRLKLTLYEMCWFIAVYFPLQISILISEIEMKMKQWLKAIGKEVRVKHVQLIKRRLGMEHWL